MNIKAVAARAGVSTATVSRTINGSSKVNPETASRVRAAIAALNFVPNHNARALGSGRSNLLGLIISDITNPFFPELVKAFEDIALEWGKDVLITNTDYDPERTRHCVSRMRERKVDGVAIMTSEVGDHLTDLLRRGGIPMVFLDQAAAGAGISCVQIDYGAGVEMAVSHLNALGHTSIAFISGPMQLASARTRHQAFTESGARDHLQASPEFVQEGNHRTDGGFSAMQRLLALPERPTAVLCSNDLTAIGALGAIAAAGLRVPEDISLIGFDDIKLSAYTDPPLTTVRLPYARIARASVQALLRASGEPGVPDRESEGGAEVRVIEPLFVERRSTGPVARR